MANNNYPTAKNRSEDKRFFGLPYRITKHPNFTLVSAQGVKLLVDIGRQYMGSNNGDLCATWSIMSKRGWKSKETLSDAVQELEHYGLIVMTQEGGRNKPNLYALAWRKIDKSKMPDYWKVGQIPGSWKNNAKKFIKPSTIRRDRKKKVRNACQISTGNVAVLRPIKSQQ